MGTEEKLLEYLRRATANLREVPRLLAPAARFTDGTQVRKNLYASHSQYVGTIREPLAEVLAPTSPRLAAASFYSTVTGGPFDATGLDAEYWLHSLRRTVHFEQATRALLTDGFGLSGGRR